MSTNLKIIGPQIRAARALIDINLFKLAELSGVNERTLRRYEAQDGVPADRAGNLQKVKTALERQGIEFIGSPDRNPGVILKK
jgi:transcriptional regulator with XRE-family HTH domain